MSIANVQNTGTTSNSLAFGSANTAGNLLVACIQASDTVTGVTDTAGNTWAKAIDLPSVSALAGAIWYVANCVAGSNTVTAANSFGGSFCNIWISEYSGCATVSPLDQTAAANGSDVNHSLFDSGSTGTTSQDDELLVGMAANSSALTATWTQPTNVQYDATTGASRQLTVADQIVSSMGIYSSTGTWSGSTIQEPVLIATFKAGGGPPPATPWIGWYLDTELCGGTCDGGMGSL